jgi:hypothetical protein
MRPNYQFFELTLTVIDDEGRLVSRGVDGVVFVWYLSMGTGSPISDSSLLGFSSVRRFSVCAGSSTIMSASLNLFPFSVWLPKPEQNR